MHLQRERSFVRTLPRNRSFPFDPEALVTTKFVRAAVDADDTVPVALYTNPYELFEVAEEDDIEARWMRASCNLVAMTEHVALLDEDELQPAPSMSLRLFVTITLLAGAFAFGTAIAFLALR